MTITFNFLDRLGDSEQLMEAVSDYFMEAVKAGEFPNYRSGPDGGESVLYIGCEAAPMAFATFFPVRTTSLWLDLFYVRPALRRKGIGRQLLTEVKRRATLGDFERVEFGTLADNEAMLALAKTAGFMLEGHLLAGPGRNAAKAEA